MTAIFGVYSLDGSPIERADLEKMMRVLRHRGQDSYGLWCTTSIGFGRRIIHTTPESRFEQPVHLSPDGSLSLVADARLDKREELQTALGLPASSSERLTDAHLLLSAYEKWGESCPEKLSGDFAFAIKDHRKRVLFCARDRLGCKPFVYYFRPGSVFVFASEVKGVLCSQRVPLEINDATIGDFLFCNKGDQTRTFYSNVCKLPAAHSLTLAEGRIRTEAYWHLDPAAEVRCSSDEEYAERFRDLFVKSVSSRMRTDSALGSKLSGGQDTSAICCVARKVLQERGGGVLRTFSMLYPDSGPGDERRYVQSVVNMGNIEPYYVHAEELSPLKDMERVFRHIEGPYSPTTYVLWVPTGLAQEQGVQVLFEGYGGDQVVHPGYHYLAELAARFRWRRLASELRPIAAIHKNPFRPMLRRYIWRFGLRPWVPDLLRRAWRQLRGPQRPLASESRPWQLINPDFARRINLKERVKRFHTDYKEPLPTDREDHYRDLMSGGLQDGLELIDKIAAAFSVEIRCPFADPDLAQFCLALPSDQKLHLGYDRWILRHALANLRPREITNRIGKADLGPDWVRQLFRLEKANLHDALYGSDTIGEYVDIGAIRSTYKRLIETSSYITGSLDEVGWVYDTAILSLWLQRGSRLDQICSDTG